jgi:hypothetical protein
MHRILISSIEARAKGICLIVPLTIAGDEHDVPGRADDGYSRGTQWTPLQVIFFFTVP